MHKEIVLHYIHLIFNWYHDQICWNLCTFSYDRNHIYQHWRTSQWSSTSTPFKHTELIISLTYFLTFHMLHQNQHVHIQCRLIVSIIFSYCLLCTYVHEFMVSTISTDSFLNYYNFKRNIFFIDQQIKNEFPILFNPKLQMNMFSLHTRWFMFLNSCLSMEQIDIEWVY